MSARLPLFVTAAGTEIGKTHVAAGLARAFRDAGRAVGVLKPLMSGYDPGALAASDAGILLAAAGIVPSSDAVAAIAPWRFAAPLSPEMAAAREGRRIDFAELLQFCRGAVATVPDVLLIEGAGGAMAPVGHDHLVRDLIQALEIPAILVGGTYLGAISHALAAHAALTMSGIEVAVLVLSESSVSPVPPAEIRDTIARHLPGTAVTLVRRRISACSQGGAAPREDQDEEARADFDRLAAFLAGRAEVRG